MTRRTSAVGQAVPIVVLVTEDRLNDSSFTTDGGDPQEVQDLFADLRADALAHS